MGPFDIAAMGILTGILFVVGSLAVILTIAIGQIRTRRMRIEMLHKERMLAIEKGLPVPVDYIDLPKKRRPYVRGLVFGSIGLGIIIMGALDTDTDLIGIGSIFLLVGIALVIGDYMAARQISPRPGITPPLAEVSPGYRPTDPPM